MRFEKAVAYWIRPDGEVTGVHGTHADTVVEKHSFFKISKEQAEKLYTTYDENDLLRYFIAKGYIRIRFSEGKCFIALEVFRGNGKKLMDWASQYIEMTNVKNIPVVLEEEKTGVVHTASLIGIAKTGLDCSRVLDKSTEHLLISSAEFYKKWSLLLDNDLRTNIGRKMKYNDAAQRELISFLKSLSDEDFERAKAFVSDKPQNMSNPITEAVYQSLAPKPKVESKESRTPGFFDASNISK